MARKASQRRIIHCFKGNIKSQYLNALRDVDIVLKRYFLWSADVKVEVTFGGKRGEVKPCRTTSEQWDTELAASCDGAGDLNRMEHKGKTLS